MKRTAAVAFIFLLLFPYLLSAHAPKENRLELDRNGLRLKVKTLHPVKNGESHYVKRIEVFLNGEPVAVQDFTRQENLELLEFEFIFKKDIGWKQGDELTVISICSIFGKEKTVLKI